MKVYIASNLGFSEQGMIVYSDFLKKLKKLKLIIHDPWDDKFDNAIEQIKKMKSAEKRKEELKYLNKKIGESNVKKILGADILIAILDGPDVDSGVASEIGYAYANGLKIIGYRNDFRLSGDNEGCKINLQVEYFINKSGGKILNNMKELIAHLSNEISLSG